MNNIELSDRIVSDIMVELSGRKGFRAVIDMIDDMTQDELNSDLRLRVQYALKEAGVKL